MEKKTFLEWDGKIDSYLYTNNICNYFLWLYFKVECNSIEIYDVISSFFIFILSLPVFKMCLTFTFHKKKIYNLNIISVGYKWHPKHIITQDTESSVARKSKEISKLVCTHVRNTVGLVCLWMSNNPTSNRSICTVVNWLSENNMAMQSIPLMHNQLFN